MTNVHIITDTEEAQALIVAAAHELGDALEAIQVRLGYQLARGCLLAVASRFALPPGELEHLDARLTASSICKREGWPDPFPEALAEGKALEAKG